MTIPLYKKELIAHAAIKVLYSRFSSFPENDKNNRNAPFHIAFLNAFSAPLKNRVKNIPDFISLSSWMHGLNTSLGQSFFESVARILCDGEKRVFRGERIFTNQVSAISEKMISLKNGTDAPSLRYEEKLLEYNSNGALQQAADFTADCFYESDDEVVAVELKSVRPNSGEMRGEKQKILQSKAVLKRLYPNKEVKYFFGFPFDPTDENSTGYNKPRFLKYLVEAEKFIDADEILIADELWSYLADCEDAMKKILQIINTIATPQFMDKFEQIQSLKNDYKNILNEWYMFSELKILKRIHTAMNKSSKRILNQKIFKPDGSYNENKYKLLNDN